MSLHVSQLYLRLVRLLVGTALTLGCVTPVVAQSVSISFNGTGLSSLQYNGSNLLAYGDFRMNQIEFLNADGSITIGNTASTVSVQGNRQTRTYDWGVLTLDYAAAGSQLSLTVGIQNKSAKTIQGIWFEPLGLKFPTSVKEYDGNTPLLSSTTDGPSLQTMSYSTGVVLLASDDVTKPLQLGFPWALDRPISQTVFPISVNTDRVFMYPTNTPTIVRPIAPGGSDQFRMSLRFGPVGSTITTLGSDVLKSYASAYPQTLNWPDRRSIGMVVLATAATGWSTNPRGWLLDPTIDVTSPQGLAAFKTRILNLAKGSVSILQSMNSQGAITWDIEGEQFTHPTTYIGDPRVTAQLAPEMDAIADAYFKTFRDAGLKVGVCIRPQRLVLAAGKTPDQQVATDMNEVLQLLIAKAKYAHDRWGATIFYVDSNVLSYTDGHATPASLFSTLQSTFPDSLFIPEHATTQYWASTAPYKELGQGYYTTPSDVRAVYPNSFSILVPKDTPLSASFNTLVTSVQQGDILMYRAWFDDEPANNLIKNIYQLASRVTVSVSAPTTSIMAGQTDQLTATITGSSNTLVSWTLSASVGSISASGLYTAPASVSSIQTVTATAVSLADPRQSSSIVLSISPVPVVVPPTAPRSSSTTVRINSGGSDFIDSLGQVWQADKYYTGGTAYTTPVPVANTTSLLLYQQERWGSFDYNIPVPNGTYAVTLKFAELYVTGPNQRLFNLAINGSTALTNFDIFVAAGGANRAIDKTFTAVVQNGQILLHFTANVNNASVRGIQVVPATVPGFQTIRVKTGGQAYTDTSGNYWAADYNYTGGQAYSNSANVAGTTDPVLYQSQRYGTFSYTFPAASGNHRVTLKFADIYYSTPGKRIFNVTINGVPALVNFDIAANGGAFRATDYSFTIPITGSGQIVVSFTPVVEYPMVSAIQID